MPLIFQKGTNSQRSQTLVIGSGLNLDQTAEGLAQISAGSSSPGEAVIQPSGGDDTAAIQNAIWANPVVRLAAGTFNTSAVIDVAAGVLVTGSGMDKTTVMKGNFNGAAFRFGDQTQFAGLANMRIVGPGKGIAAGNKGVQAARSAPPQGLAIARRLSFRNLYIKDIGEQGMYFDNCAGVEIDNVILENIGFNPIYFSGGGSSRISTVRAIGTGTFYIRYTSGVTLISCEAESAYGSFRFNNATDCALIGCVSRKCEEVPLKINAGSSLFVAGFGSDNTGTAFFVNQPHLLVDGGALGVHINGFRRVNTDQAGSLTSEANVSAAGGPVLIGFHNFDAAKIVSGGKFSDLAATARA